MASTYWRTDHTVETLLAEQQVGWEFLQLVKLILSMTDDEGIADDNAILNRLSEKIKFKASLAADFPPSEIRKVQHTGEDKPVDITLINNVLSSNNGPLPEPFLAWIRGLSHSGDHAMADFLDLFNNRLSALRYLIARVTRPNLIDAAANNTETGTLFHSLSGALFNRKVQDADLRLTGLLANNRMSFPVVKQMLYFCMGLPLQTLNSYRGGWLSVDKQDHSMLGNKQVCRLGKTATLGTKVWDQQQAIELVIGPLSWSQVRALVPGGDNFQEFVNLLRRITDCRCDCKIVLLLPQQQLPTAQLGTNSRIGSITVEQESENKTSEKLALGLTTALSTAKKRMTSDKLAKIRFTVETSNLDRQMAA